MDNMQVIQTAPFLSLPREIRDQIYGYLLPYKTAIRVRTQPRRYYRIYNNQLGRLRGTCRQIWDEGSEFLYASSKIKFVEGVREISQGLTNFVPLVGHYIQTIQLRPHFVDTDRGYIQQPDARSYRRSFRPSVGAIGRSCQEEIRRILRLLDLLPRLRALEIHPYGGDLVDFLEPMQYLYVGLIALSGKPNLQEIKIQIKLFGEDKPPRVDAMITLVLSRLLGREPLSAELPDERGYSTITEFPLLRKCTTPSLG
jgi:hypothetical protein